jgi:hypothetical protein
MTAPLDSRYFEIREELLGRRAHELVTKDDLMILGDVMYGDSGLLRIYGLSIDDLTERGFGILGRTAVECCIDAYAEDAANVALEAAEMEALPPQPLIVDLFSGSANLLYWTTFKFGAPGIGSEADPAVYQETFANLARLDLDARVIPGGFTELPGTREFREAAALVYLLDPPWGDAFDGVSGLDLGRTTPPVHEALEWAREHAGGRPCIALVKASEHGSEQSVRRLAARARLVVRRRSVGAPRLAAQCLAFGLSTANVPR